MIVISTCRNMRELLHLLISGIFLLLFFYLNMDFDLINDGVICPVLEFFINRLIHFGTFEFIIRFLTSDTGNSTLSQETFKNLTPKPLSRLCSLEAGVISRK